MKAAVLSGARQILIKDVPRPEPGPDEVLVKVEYGGICGSDIHAYHDLTFPIGTILGHEFTGTIAKLGDPSSGFQEGQRIVARPAGMCGECEWCHRGELGLCKDHLQNTLGLNLAGGFAEYVKMKSYQAISLADEISFQEGAQLEPLAVSFHAVKLAPLRVGEAVAIFGAGPIGLLVLQLVRAAGARPAGGRGHDAGERGQYGPHTLPGPELRGPARDRGRRAEAGAARRRRPDERGRDHRGGVRPGVVHGGHG